MRSPAERFPCSECGLGVMSGHLSRHLGSKVCERTQRRMQFTRDLLSPAYMLAEKMATLGSELLKMAEELKRA